MKYLCNLDIGEILFEITENKSNFSLRKINKKMKIYYIEHSTLFLYRNKISFGEKYSPKNFFEIKYSLEKPTSLYKKPKFPFG